MARKANPKSVKTPASNSPAHQRWYANPLVYFAGISACAAVTSAWAAFSNVDVARGQAAITRLQYTPQLALDIDQISGFEEGQPLTTLVHIKNVGSLTVYDAKVTAHMAVLPNGDETGIWGMPDRVDAGITLAPTEQEMLPVVSPAPTKEQRDALAERLAIVVAAGQIEYFDELGRHHVRYTCASYRQSGKALIGTFCQTPKQN